MSTPVLEVTGLNKRFALPRKGWSRLPPRYVNAVSEVSLRLMPGETLGIVGESGCGKSTTARLIMELLIRDSGDILYEGRRLGPGGLAMRDYRRNV